MVADKKLVSGTHVRLILDMVIAMRDVDVDNEAVLDMVVTMFNQLLGAQNAE